MKRRGINKTNHRETDPIKGVPFDFLFIKSKKSQPPNANIVISFNPKSAHDQGAPA